MASSPWRGTGLGTVTTFLAAWNSLAVLVFLGPRLRASAAALVGIAAAFDVAAAAAVGAGTVWSRRVGSRAALASGSAAFALASAGCALVSAPPVLIAARAVQGIAAAVMVSAAFEALAGPPRPVESGPGSGGRGGGAGGGGSGAGGGGFQAGGVGAALVCGPLLAGAAATVHGWRWVFWGDAIAGAAVCAVVLVRGRRAVSPEPGPTARSRPESESGSGSGSGSDGDDGAPTDRARPPRDLFDLLGLALITVAVAGPVAALDQAASAGWADIRTLALLAAGLLALVPILVWQTPLGALYGRAFIAAQVADLCLFAATAGTLFLLVQYFHVMAGSGPLGVGLRIVPWSAAVAVVLPVSASVDVGARGMRRLIAAGMALDAIGLLGLATGVRGRQTGWWLAVSLVVSGAGVGLAMPAARRAAVTVAGLRQPEGVVGGLGAVRWAGAALGIALLGAVLVARGGLGPGGFGSASASGAASASASASAVRGAAPAVATAALLAAVGAAAALMLPARDRPPMAPVFSRPDSGG
ncbi:MFS family permease [Catenulispora sp. EB89]|uniref:MFS transporter n=1 Tax=Catenulispora sp. EB89 TaxID=3156257 RepID=UPI00351778E7